MSSRPTSRRHLEAVPDLDPPSPAPQGPAPKNPAPKNPRRGRQPEPGLFDLPEPSPAPPGTGQPAIPEHVSAAEVRRVLADMGAPADLQEAVAEFGDDMPALSTWLQEIGALGDPADVLNPMLGQWADLLERGVRAIEAEVCTGEFLHAYGQAAGSENSLIGSMELLIEEAAATRTREALAMCRCLAHLGPAEIRATAARAGHELTRYGIKDMPWVKDLGRAEFVDAFGYGDDRGLQESLVLEFRHGRRGHAFVVLIDHRLGGGIKDLFATDDPDELRRDVQFESMLEGVEVTPHSPAEASARLHAALDAPVCADDPEQVQDVGIHLPILLDRLPLLPAPPADARPRAAGRAATAAIRRASARRGRPEPKQKPARSPDRRAPVAPTSVHRIKVTLAGSKPPIWRRLEVPSSTTLMRLHEIIQATFDWHDSHLWMFETSDVVFGVGELGVPHRNARRVRIGQVAPAEGDTLRYVYDFGDDWNHRIVVEAVADAESEGRYPRCLNGRRSAPPEDCGGIWGYAELVESLADKTHPEHADRLEWLGLDSAREFDPARFDAAAANARLAPMAGRRR
ncbi:MAG TPA: plasmid pRiA4b ORF-3 family protein [Nakamurella sp.]